MTPAPTYTDRDGVRKWLPDAGSWARYDGPPSRAPAFSPGEWYGVTDVRPAPDGRIWARLRDKGGNAVADMPGLSCRSWTPDESGDRPV